MKACKARIYEEPIYWKMGMYVAAPVRLSLHLWLRFVLCFSISGLVAGFIKKHCITFDGHLIRDIGTTISCNRLPELGPFGECDIDDFERDLLEVGPGIRTLCVFTHATSIPANAFSHITTLEFLYIDGNCLKYIHPSAFSGLLNLKYLHLYFNVSYCSTVTMDSVFDGLGRVEELTLKGFQLANTPSTIFDRLVGLVKLTLDYVCVQDLGEIFCRLPNQMSHLKHLRVADNYITTVRKGDCPSASTSWPSNVLSGIQSFDLNGNPIKSIEAGSLAAFQNLSNLSLSYYGAQVGSIWESGVGKVTELTLLGDTMNLYSTNFRDLCHLASCLQLRSLTLYHIAVDILSAKDFIDCGIDLKELDVCNSEIQHLDPGFWTSIAGLEVVHMENIKLTEAPFCVACNGTVWNLTILSLMYNQLTVIKTDQFVCTPFLQQLLLNNNKISTLEPGAFRNLLHLRVLNLNFNHIKILAADDFHSLRALEILLINNNYIETIEDGILRYQGELRELELGKLVYIYALYLNMIFFGFPEKMQRLYIDADAGTAIYLGNSIQPKRTFIFELSGNMLYIMSHYTPFFEAVRELKLSGSLFNTKNYFFVPYFINIQSLELTCNPETVNVNYSGISDLRKLKRLKLVNVNFSNHTNPGSTFWNLKHLQILVLYNCRLAYLTRVMFRDLQSLELLRLYNVNPLILQDGMFDLVPALSTFVFDRVDFRCDCENGWLLEWAESTRVQIIYLQRQQCIWHYQKLNFLSTVEKLCQTDMQYLCYMGTAISISILLSAAVGYRFAHWPCVVLFFRIRGFAERKFGRGWLRKKRVRQEEEQLEEEEEERYDAFVSFSSHDEAWVLGEMAQRLEEQGQPRLRLCLHHRDFEVGKGIVDNIAESIYSSRRTVCVLSRQYLRSDWCSLEMRVATYRLLEEHKHRLILIFLEHISPFELSAFHRLAKLVQSRTYLDWPQDEAERIHFWERLRRNIAGEDMDDPQT